jgi:cytochrome c biogenesis protein CcdA
MVFISGFAYTLGRMAAYAALGLIIINSFLNVPQVAQFLQKYMGKALGPILIITGLFLLELITIRLSGMTLSEKHQHKLAESGAPGAFALGFIFALAFCPVSAALFFGSLIPLALSSKSGVFLPLIYGIGTGLPVLVFAVAIALGVKSLSHFFKKISVVELYVRKITGIIFIFAGFYYLAVYWLRLF